MYSTAWAPALLLKSVARRTPAPFFGAQFFVGGRRPKDHEPALGADWHDDRVLHRLGFDHSEYLGPVVFPPVRGAETTTCDAPEAQVHPFDTRRADEEFGVRARLR